MDRAEDLRSVCGLAQSGKCVCISMSHVVCISKARVPYCSSFVYYDVCVCVCGCGCGCGCGCVCLHACVCACVFILKFLLFQIVYFLFHCLCTLHWGSIWTWRMWFMFTHTHTHTHVHTHTHTHTHTHKHTHTHTHSVLVSMEWTKVYYQ